MRHFRGHSQVSGETRTGAGFAVRSESSGRIWYLGHQPDTCHFTPTWQWYLWHYGGLNTRDAEMSEILVWQGVDESITDSPKNPNMTRAGCNPASIYRTFPAFGIPLVGFLSCQTKWFCFQSYYVVCKDRWKLLVLRQIWGIWVFQCQGALVALVVFQFRNCEALAALADLASSEKGAMVVAEIGALPLCVSLLQSSEEANSLCEAWCDHQRDRSQWR